MLQNVSFDFESINAFKCSFKRIQLHNGIATYGTDILIKLEAVICYHYNDVIMSAMSSQITGFSVVYWTVSSDVDYWSFVWGIHRSPVDSPHKGPVRTKKTPKLCERNPPMTSQFPAQRASNAEIVFILWRWWHQGVLHRVKCHGFQELRQ